MKKILLSIFVVVLGLSLSSPTSFASVSSSGESVSASIQININDDSFRVVSEEEVILDFMTKENVNRDTAIERLGINDNEDINILASCSTQWRFYSSTAKVVDSLSQVSLTVSPYAQVETCDGKETFKSVSSAQPAYEFHGLLSNSAKLTTATAVKIHDRRIDVAASGYIDPILGSKRYWTYTDCIYGKSSGSTGCF